LMPVRARILPRLAVPSLDSPAVLSAARFA
jgi:hypothetical protein